VDDRHKRKAFCGNSEIVQNRTNSLLAYFSWKCCSIA